MHRASSFRVALFLLSGRDVASIRFDKKNERARLSGYAFFSFTIAT